MFLSFFYISVSCLRIEKIGNLNIYTIKVHIDLVILHLSTLKNKNILNNHIQKNH